MNHLRSDSGSNGLAAKDSSPLLGNRPILIFSGTRFFPLVSNQECKTQTMPSGRFGQDSDSFTKLTF